MYKQHGGQEKRTLLIVGSGEMGRSHARAASELGWLPVAVCRAAESSRLFSDEMGFPCASGGVEAWLSSNPVPENAVVAVGIEFLSAVATTLIKSGVRRLLVEKPAGVRLEEIVDLANVAAQHEAKVFVAYNRRFYDSVLRAKEIIGEDGGPTSLRFDFTERVDLVAAGKQSHIVKENWFLANSTHVVDLAFYLGGLPATLDAKVFGKLDWHPLGSRFVGSGSTQRGAVFSYSADWDAPGRWTVDVRTRRRRLLLEPLEQLRIQRFGSFDLVDEPLQERYPGRLKPGIVAQMAAFLKSEHATNLIEIGQHLSMVNEVYLPMLVGASCTFTPQLERRLACR